MLFSRSARPSPGGSAHSTTRSPDSCRAAGVRPRLWYVSRVTSCRSASSRAHWYATHASPTSSPSQVGAISSNLIRSPYRPSGAQLPDSGNPARRNDRWYTVAGMCPELSVVVVTYNSAHVVGELLDSLPAALGGVSADVVVVDNGSTDGTAELLAARADCRLVEAANRGYAAGINRGVREGAPAEAVLVLNPDVRLMSGAVPPLLAALRLPGTGVAAPQVREPGGALSWSLRREP